MSYSESNQLPDSSANLLTSSCFDNMLAIENDNEGLMTLTILFVDGDDEADDVDDGGTTWWCLFVASDDVTDDCD